MVTSRQKVLRPNRETIDNCCPEMVGPFPDYIRSMWRLTLDNLHTSEHAVGKSDSFDAIPYVPESLVGAHFVPSSQSRVVDIGCLGGYGLFDYLYRLQTSALELPEAVGVDSSADSVAYASALLPSWSCGADVSFLNASCEQLPLDSSSVDLVVARLVVQYASIRKSLSELSRVLKPGGVLLLQIHSFAYYRGQLQQSRFCSREFIYYLLAIASGIVYCVAGRQPLRREAALTVASLRRTASPLGLRVQEIGGGAPKPLILLKKVQDTRG